MDKYYYELCIAPSKFYHLFCDFVLELGIDAIEEKDGTIIIRDKNDLSQIKWGVENFAKELGSLTKEDIKLEQSISKKENIDWIEKYKNSIKPVKAGKFYIHPTWEKGREDLIDIKIDPALSFGTGHHESTSSCLEILGYLIKKDDTVLDVGCGSGILAIASNKLGAIVDLCDTDPLSIESSKKNFKLNDTQYRHIWEGSANKSKDKYDIVIANIVADILIMINKDLKKTLKDRGNLILSGILDKYLDKVLSNFNDFEVIQKIKKKEWITLHLKREK